MPFLNKDQIEVIKDMIKGLPLTQQFFLGYYEFFWFLSFYLLVLFFEKKIKK